MAERIIRPLAGERKNSLFFGSDKMAQVSTVYHTIISACKMQGISVLVIPKNSLAKWLRHKRLSASFTSNYRAQTIINNKQ